MRRPFFWALFLGLLFHVSGAVGMVYYDREVFVSMTPLNLCIMFLLLLINETQFSRSLVYALLISFFVGLFTEMIGVKTGVLFGNYSYGDVMGTKIFQVPLLIGINWFSIVFCSYVLVVKYTGQPTSTRFVSAMAAGVATAFDWLMEPVAMELGFWSWHQDSVPLLNYICWFVISFLLVRLFLLLKVSTTNPFAPYLLLIQAVFFLFLRLVL